MTTLILLATYNGEPYLAQQLASLSAQTDPDWQLLARDDGSGDGTRALLRKAAEADPRIELMPDDGRRNGPAGNFARLMQTALARNAPYIAFCDQDDVWLPEKLARQRSALAELERMHGRSCPILVHSDLEVVDRDLQPIHPSLARFQLINQPAGTPPLTLLTQNHVVGCSMMMNRALLELATPMPPDVYMHDWWVALCAGFAGVHGYLPEALARYRQHADNRVGAKGVMGRLSRPWLLTNWLVKMNAIYHVTWRQAAYLATRLRERPEFRADGESVARRLDQLDRFLSLTHSPRPLRGLGLLRMGVRCQNPIMTTLYYLQSLTLRLDPVLCALEPPCAR